MTINVYEQYFGADLMANGVPRRGALVMLIADSEAGHIRYEAAVTFFPHEEENDFAVSYDAYFERELYFAKGRRSKKREAALLEGLREIIDETSAEHKMKVCWEKPLREERRG